MKVSNLKTQWWRLLLGLVCLIFACVYAFQPAADESTLEGVRENLKTMINATSWLLSCLLWFVISFLNWHEDCIRELDKKNRDLEERVEALENRAITDIDEVNPNHFVARRRLGPDKVT